MRSMSANYVLCVYFGHIYVTSKAKRQVNVGSSPGLWSESPPIDFALGSPFMVTNIAKYQPKSMGNSGKRTRRLIEAIMASGFWAAEIEFDSF